MRSPRSFLAGALLALALLSAPVFAQTVRFVDVDAAGIGDGSSWTDAFPDLQQALAVAEVGDEIWVAEGTYRPTDTTDRDASFVLVSGTGLYGGFDGTEDARDERDPEQNVTVLSGDLGVPGDISDNAYHVIIASGVDDSTVLDGFTVTGGNGNGANPRNRGGGIYAENSSLMVRDCRIVVNRVVQTDGNGGGGGAFFGTSGSPWFERVVFERNGLNALGGGLWLRGDVEVGAGTATAAAFARHKVEGLDGTDLFEAGPDERAGSLSAMLRDVSFVENTGSFGGAVNIDRATVEVVGSVFLRNFAFDGGGGMTLSATNAQLINVEILGNVTDPEAPLSSSGGINSFASSIALTNADFTGNTADFAGAFSQGGGGNSVLTNVTFTANEGEQGSAIRLANGAEANVRNSILWGNSGKEIFDLGGTAILSHVIVDGGFEGNSVINADPLFVHPPDPGPDEMWGTADDDYGDLRLQTSSPAIDFGLTEFLPPDAYDLDADGDTDEPLPVDLAGEPRVVGETVDLGAYEWQFPVAAESDVAVSAFTLDAYPNPTRGPVTVSLRLDRSQWAEVVLFDVLGREVAVLHDGPLAAGRHALRLNAADLPSGVYLLRLSVSASSATRRVVVLR